MARTRIALFDSVKGILIILVVMGHFMHPIHNDNQVLSALFDIIYLFHMPLFVFVSGLFAKGAYRDGHLNINRMISFGVLGLAFQAALLAINGTFALHRLVLFSSAPWYLIGMVWWYLATPVLARVSAPAGVAACLAISLLAGCMDMHRGFLAITRSLAFLPYFALGYYCTTGRMEQIARGRPLWGAVALAAAIALARVLDPNAYAWFFPMVYGDNPYEQGVLAGMAAKLATVAIAITCSLAVLRLAPKQPGPLAVLGERTLQIYVLHRLIRAWLTFRTPFYGLAILLDPLIGSAIIIALSGGIVAFCALPILSRPFDALLHAHWLPRDGREHA